ncbi:MAG TPA: DUF6599 family protein [Bryobacteraceae bacterium]
MPRCLKFAILIGFASATWSVAAIFPENWGDAKLTGKPAIVTLTDRPLAEELGFEAGERADFTGPMGKFAIEAHRFKDPTSALSYYFASRPTGFGKAPDAFVKTEPLALSIPGGLFWAHGNYVFNEQGWTPAASDLKVLYAALAKFDQSSLPVLPGYLPQEGRLAGSERYVIGPATLERYEGRIGAATAAFSMGAEAVVADYGNAGRLSIFNYPTHDIARQRVDEFRKAEGSVVKRSGPLVAVMMGSGDPNGAERILAKVNYQASLTWNEPDPNLVVKNTGKMLLSIVELAGLIGALAVGTGIMFGLLRYLRRRYSPNDVDESMITLDLSK